MTDGNHPESLSHPAPSAIFCDGLAVGIGSLPHLDPVAAAEFAIAEFDIPTVPSLPVRSVAEGMLSQAITDIDGVSVSSSGALDLDLDRIDIADVQPTDLSSDAFVGLNSFLELAAREQFDGSPLKWQFVGPVTLGVALQRAGLDTNSAFDLASATVARRLTDISEAVTEALPDSPQMVVLDEPWFTDLMSPGFPIPPDEAIDRMSSAMSSVPSTSLVGIHSCGSCDVATLLASGPSVISLPASPELVDWAGYLTRFLDDGGVIVWGVSPTDGPVPLTSDRYWRELCDLWCGLVQRGCDPVTLRRNSMVSPECGLTMHTVAVAREIARLTATVGRRVQDQSTATRFALGA